MPAYRYRAVDFSGRVARGSLAAANEQELAQNLNHAGLELIDARASKKESTRRRLQECIPQNLAPDMLAQFAAQMKELLGAGIPFPEAIQDLVHAPSITALQDALADIHRALHHGSTIAEAFGRHPRLFPDIFTAILAAGEKSGDLTSTFAHLARYAEARAKTIAQFRRAIRYPLFLLLVTVGVVAFMTTMVIPPIIEFLNSFGTSLPPSTRILIATSNLFAGYWWLGLLLVLGGGTGLHLARRFSPRAACAIDGMILRIPLIGIVLHKLALARFTHSFAILFQSGIGVVDSLRGAGITLGNRALTAALESSERQVQSGRALSAALTGMFPSFALHMIRIGERSGNLNKAFDDIARICDRDVADATGKLIGAMEPALTIMIGSILAWIVLAVLGPVYGNLGHISSMM